LEPLIKLVKGMPPTLRAALFVVIHTPKDANGLLAEILARESRLAVRKAHDTEPIQYGRVYIAPPDHHLLLRGSSVAVTTGPRENGFRPAIDPLFRSAAQSHGSRVIGVVLSGALDDGTFGLVAIKRVGGLALVQHPNDSLMPSMPVSAIQNVEVDLIASAAELSEYIVSTVGERGSGEDVFRSPTMKTPAEEALEGMPPDEEPGSPSLFTCPECGGALWAHESKGLLRFRCHTGHGFTAETLSSLQGSHLEEALWTAVRVLQERAALHRQQAQKARERNASSSLGERYEQRSDEEMRNAEEIRKLLLKISTISPDAKEPPAA
jgi:two-component system chemotaxis response regulator CheB